MADTKTTALTEAAAITSDDLFYIVDDPAGTPTSKKATATTVRNFTNGVYSAYSTDDNLAAAVNTYYFADISGFSANRTLTLPATAAVGDFVGLHITNGDDAFEFLITATSGDTLNAVAGGSEWSRLFITGEYVLMRCIVANTTWVVERDGRIPQKGKITVSTAGTTNSAGTITNPSSSTNYVGTSTYAVGVNASTANCRFTVRRANYYRITGQAMSLNAISDQNYYGVYVYQGSNIVGRHRVNQSSSAVIELLCSSEALYAAGDTADMRFRPQEADKGIAISSFVAISEILR